METQDAPTLQSAPGLCVKWVEFGMSAPKGCEVYEVIKMHAWGRK